MSTMPWGQEGGFKIPPKPADMSQLPQIVENSFEKTAVVGTCIEGTVLVNFKGENITAQAWIESATGLMYAKGFLAVGDDNIEREILVAHGQERGHYCSDVTVGGGRKILSVRFTD